MPSRTNYSTSVLLAALSSPAFATSIQPNAPIQVAVVGGFSPAFESMIPSLSQLAKRPIQMTSLPTSGLRTQLREAIFDLVITGAPQTVSQLDYYDQLQRNSVTVIAYSPVILWCPNPNIRMRVRITDTLKNPQIKTVALSPLHSPVGDLVREQLPITAQLQLKTAAHALEAQRMAQQGEVDCAFTIVGLVRPSGQYQFLPHRGIKIVAAIPKNSPNPSAAARLLKLLERPLFRARIQQHGYS